STRRRTHCFAECRHWRYSRAGHAAYAGRCGLATGNLVALWCPRPARASVCRRSSRAPENLAPQPQAYFLQCAPSRGPAGRGLRRARTLEVPRNADFYMCGPPAFMSDLTIGLADWGVAADRIHTEIFGSGPSKTPGIAAAPRRPPHRPSGPQGTGPLITFARSGLNVRWGPTFESVLELAEACDVPVRWACRTGVCHSCETGLVLGTVSYRPEPIDAPADGNVLICCCQPQGDIVIDL